MTKRHFSNGLLTLMKISLLFSILLLLPAILVMTTPDPGPEDWPMWNNDGTGYTTSTAPSTNVTRWNFTTKGDMLHQPTIKGGKLYIMSGDGIFYCLNASTGGPPIWTKNMTIALNTATTAITRSTAAVADGKIYGGTFDPPPYRVFCLNATNGDLLWNITTGQICGSPMVIAGKLYVGDYSGRAYCLDATTGAQIWNNTAIGSMIASTVAIADGKMYLGTTSNAPNPYKVFCLNATDGSHLWNYTAKASIWNVLVSDGKVYADQSRLSFAEPGNVYCLDATTGTKIWNFSIPGFSGWDIRSPLSVHGDKLFFGADDRNVYCINKNTGAKIWNYTTGGIFGYTGNVPAISSDGKVLIGCRDNCLYCLDESTGALIWKYNATAVSGIGGTLGIWGNSIADGIVYFSSWDDNIYAIPEFPTWALTLLMLLALAFGVSFLGKRVRSLVKYS